MPNVTDPVATLVFFLIVFLAVSVIFLFIHLLMGSFLRPHRPDDEKLTIYECGEPTVGSAWVQFDLRYYVVALLFVVFDVEVAFFFPWAVVFGTANQIAATEDMDRRQKLSERLVPDGSSAQYKELHGLVKSSPPQQDEKGVVTVTQRAVPIDPAAAKGWAWVAFFDLLVFFGVLMVGFAYLWRRGDIDWIKTVTHKQGAPPG